MNYDQRKILFKNRKRIILDRGPNWPDYDKAEAFVVRYYLLFRKRPKWFPFNIGGIGKLRKKVLFGGGLAMWVLEEGLIGIV